MYDGTHASNLLLLQAALQEESEKYEQVQKLQAYIRELCACLAEKGAVVEELEEHVKRAREDRMDAIKERRKTDLQDENRSADAAVAAVLHVLTSGGDPSAAQAAAAEASRKAADSSDDVDNGRPQLDEFGRDLNLARKLERKRRQEKRIARKSRKNERREIRRREATTDVKWGAALVGESSSDESEDELIAFRSTCKEVQETAKVCLL